MNWNGSSIVNKAGAVAIVIGVFASLAVADEIRIGTIAYPGIRITKIDDDSLQYFINGRTRTAGLDRVEVVEINSYPRFAEGVKELKSDPAQAVRVFRGLLSEVKEDYLRPLVQSQYIAALDQAGQFDQAVGEYLKLVKQHPGSYYATLAPQTVPRDADQLKTATANIGQAMAGISNAGAKAAVGKLLAKIGAAEKAPAATGENNGTGNADNTTPGESPGEQPEPAGPQASFISMTVIERLMQSKQYDKAVEQANLMMDRPNAPLPDLFYQRAIAEETLGQFDRAVMSYLRVAIHFPDHKLAIPALFQAGQALSKAGDNVDAAKVFTEALSKATDAQTKQQIQRALDALPAEARK